MCPIYPDAWPPLRQREEVYTLIREAIALYVKALKEEGLPVPEPQSYELVEA